MRRFLALAPATLVSGAFAALGLVCSVVAGGIAWRASSLVGHARTEGILGAGILVVWGTGLPVLLAAIIAFFGTPAHRHRLYVTAAAVASLRVLVLFSLS